jgi:pyruvate,water dikinase
MIRYLSDLSSDDIELFGLKAAYLGELLDLGFNVPNGFVISTDQKDPPADETLALFDSLNTQFVAVRSSPPLIGPDKDPCIGQLETINWVDRNSLLKAIYRCRSSVYSRHAEMYMLSHNVSDIPLAVLVQTMIKAESSGVVYTRNGEGEGQMLIKACFGAGDAVVSGRVKADSYIIDGRTGETTDEEVNEQKIMSTQAGWTQVRPEDYSKRKLPIDYIHRVADMARAVEEHFGRPQDIEFCFDDRRLWILQARPLRI